MTQAPAIPAGHYKWEVQDGRKETGERRGISNNRTIFRDLGKSSQAVRLYAIGARWLSDCQRSGTLGARQGIQGRDP